MPCTIAATFLRYTLYAHEQNDHYSFFIFFSCLVDWSLLSQDVGIFGYSRKNLTDEDLRSIIASTLTCRVDHLYVYISCSWHKLGIFYSLNDAYMFRENCGDKMDAFLSRTYYINGGYDNRDGMSRLDERMKQIEVSLCVFSNIWTDKHRQFNNTLPASIL